MTQPGHRPADAVALAGIATQSIKNLISAHTVLFIGSRAALASGSRSL